MVENGADQILDGTIQFSPLPDIKNILVTGGNGFVGSWIIRTLALTYADSYRLISFDMLDYGGSTNNTQMLEAQRNFTFVEGSIMSYDDVTACLDRYQIDTIIHLAAQTNVDNSLKDPFQSASTNIQGTQIMLECARVCGVKRFILMSSGEVYGAAKPGTYGYCESQALAPTNPYGAGKAAAEMLAIAVGNSSPLEVMTVRPNNIYGPNQFPDNHPEIHDAPSAQVEAHTLQGGGFQRKRYLYVGDVANAFNVILHRGKHGDVFNLGSDDEISNRDLAARLIDIVNPDGDSPPPNGDRVDIDAWIKAMPGRPYVDSGAGLDCRKLQALGWEPQVSLDMGLKRTADWYALHGDSWWSDISRIYEGQS